MKKEKEEFPIPKHLLRESASEAYLRSFVELNPIAKTSELVAPVLRTKDYGIFKRHIENRRVVRRQLERLKKSMKKIGWLPGSYVIIYPDGRVIEGHHRVLVAQETDNWVYFIIVNEEIENHVSLLNKDKEPWKPIDYIETYAKRNNQDYILLLDFIDDYPEISASNCMRFCLNSENSTTSKVFENGLYKVKDMTVARKWAEQLKQLRPFLLLRDATPEKEDTQINSSFVRAFLHMAQKEDFVFEKFMAKLQKKYPKGVVRQDGLPKSIELFEKIYNSRKPHEEE